MTTRLFRSAVNCLVAAVFILGTGHRCNAQAPADDLEPTIREEQVPLNELTQRLATGDYVPVTQNQWEQLKSIKRRTATIREARYTGKMKNRSLIGTFTAQIFGTAANAGSVELTPLSLSVANLKWDNQTPAVLGANADGNQVVLTNPESKVLGGQWNAIGTAFEQSQTFQIEFPASASTTFEITTSAKFELRSTTGVVSSEAIKGKQIRWSVFAGNRTSTQLTISPVVGLRRKAVVFVEETVEVRYTNDATRVDADFKIEALDPGVAQLQFELEKSFQFDSVLYGETRLKPVTRTVGKHVRLVVTLPEALVGISRTLTIAATAATQKPGQVNVPWVRFISARSTRGAAKIAFRNETLRLRVDPPFVIESLKPNGFEQTLAVFSREGRHTVTYSRRADDASLTATLGEQDAILQPRIVETIDTTQRPITAKSKIQVRMTSGLKVFEVSCDVRDGWDMTQVTSGVDDSPLNALVVVGEADRRVLRIELPRPIVPDKQLTFTVTTQRLPNQTSQELVIPITRLTEFENSLHTIHVIHSNNSLPKIQSGSFAKIPSADVSEDADMETSDTSVLSLQSTSRIAQGSIQLPLLVAGFDASADTAATLVEDGLREKIKLQIRPLERAIKSVDVSFPGLEPPTEWTFDGQNLMTEIVSRKEGRSVIRIDLPTPLARVFQLDAERLRVVPTENISIPFVSNAGDFSGSLRFRDNTNSPYRLTSHPDLILEEDESGDRRFRTWNYQTELNCGLESDDDSDAVPIATGSLESMLASSIDGFDQHILRIQIAPETRTALRMSFPSTLIDYRVRLNGTPLSQPNTPFWLIPLSDDVESNVVEVRFRQKVSSGLLWSERVPRIPSIESHQIQDFDWNVSVRDDLLISSVPATFEADQTRKPSWTRFLGVLPAARDESSTVVLHSPILPQNLRLIVQEKSAVTRTQWALLGLTFLGGLLWRRKRSRTLPFLGAITLVLAVCFWPASLPPLPGTIFSGVLLGLLVPTALLRRTTHSIVNSDGSAGLTRVTGTALVIFALASTAVGQSDSAAGKSPVLVPVIPDGVAPIVYLESSLYENLQQRRLPHYAITKTQYEVTVDANNQATVVASASVTAKELPLRIRLPVAGMNPGICLVNGVETQYTTTANDIVVVVNDVPHTIIDKTETDQTTEETTDTDEADSAEEEEEEPNSENFTEHSIKVTLRPQIVRGTDAAELKFNTIPSIVNRYRLNLARAYPMVEGFHDAKPVIMKSESDSHSFQTGLGQVVRLRWSMTKPDAATKTAQTTSQQAFLVQLYRDFATLEIVETLDGDGHPGDLFDWTIPPELELATIASSDVVEVCRTTDLKGQTRVQFERLSAGPITLQAKLRIVWDDSNPFVLPAINLHPNQGIQTTSQIVAVSAVSGSTAQVAAEQQLEQVALPASMASLVNQNPDHVYQLAKPTRIEFKISRGSSNASRRTTRLKQTLFIGRDEVQWSATAFITSGPDSVFEHTLDLDPAIKIENVTLQAGQASRLARWKQHGGLITLFLSQPTNDDLQIGLTGRMAMAAEVRMPRFKVLDTNTEESQLDVTHSDDVRLDSPPIEDPESLELISREFETTSADEVPFGRYRVTGPIPDTPIHVHPLVDLQVTTRQLVTIHDDSMRVDTVIHVVDTEKSGQTIKLQIPKELQIQQDGIECDIAWSRSDVDPTVLLLNCDRIPVAEFDVKITAAVASKIGLVEIPSPRLSGRVLVGESYLLLGGGLRMDARNQSRLVPIRDLPGWVTAGHTDKTTTAWSGRELWRVSSIEPESTRRSRVALRIDRLANRQGGQIYGHTTIITDSRFPEVKSSWPESLELLQLRIDDKLVDQSGHAGDPEIQQDQLDQANVIEIHWMMRQPTAWYLLNQPIEFPFSQLSGETCLLEVSGFNSGQLTTGSGPTTPATSIAHATTYAKEISDIWSTLPPEKETLLSAELNAAYETAVAANRSASIALPNEELAEHIASLKLEVENFIRGGGGNGTNRKKTERFSDQQFILSPTQIADGVAIRSIPLNAIAAACLLGVLFVGWCATYFARSTDSDRRQVKVESTTAIVAGIVCLVLLQSTLVGWALIALGISAPRITKYAQKSQPATLPAATKFADPIAIAPTMKQ